MLAQKKKGIGLLGYFPILHDDVIESDFLCPLLGIVMSMPAGQHIQFVTPCEFL